MERLKILRTAKWRMRMAHPEGTAGSVYQAQSFAATMQRSAL
jgi:hypothetical protein